MKYTIAKMFQILRHNRWVSILMIIEIALGMSVFTYSLNMFFSLSREKENQKNQESADCHPKRPSVPCSAVSV